MKIYTGGGDSGSTSLLSGERIDKSDARIEAYGTVDELGAVLGLLAAHLPAGSAAAAATLGRVQCDLFDVGAWLATTPDSRPIETLTPMDTDRCGFLEGSIDLLDAALPPLQGFIVPGGTAAAGWAHLGRTVCRRAERQVVRLARNQAPARLAGVLAYLNRLSDYLFVLARHCNHCQKVPDRLWRPGHRRQAKGHKAGSAT